jgi:hypothetical protein
MLPSISLRDIASPPQTYKQHARIIARYRVPRLMPPISHRW